MGKQTFNVTASKRVTPATSGSLLGSWADSEASERGIKEPLPWPLQVLWDRCIYQGWICLAGGKPHCGCSLVSGTGLTTEDDLSQSHSALLLGLNYQFTPASFGAGANSFSQSGSKNPIWAHRHSLSTEEPLPRPWREMISIKALKYEVIFLRECLPLPCSEEEAEGTNI